MNSYMHVTVYYVISFSLYLSLTLSLIDISTSWIVFLCSDVSNRLIITGIAMVRNVKLNCRFYSEGGYSNLFIAVNIFPLRFHSWNMFNVPSLNSYWILALSDFSSLLKAIHVSKNLLLKFKTWSWHSPCEFSNLFLSKLRSNCVNGYLCLAL